MKIARRSNSSLVLEKITGLLGFSGTTDQQQAILGVNERIAARYEQAAVAIDAEDAHASRQSKRFQACGGTRHGAPQQHALLALETIDKRDKLIAPETFAQFDQSAAGGALFGRDRFNGRRERHQVLVRARQAVAVPLGVHMLAQPGERIAQACFDLPQLESQPRLIHAERNLFGRVGQPFTRAGGRGMHLAL